MNYYGITFSGTSTWQQQQASNSHLVALVQTYGNEGCQLILHSLQRVEDPFVPTLLPVLNGWSHQIHGNGHPAQYRGDGTSPGPLFSCDGHLVFCTSNKKVFGNPAAQTVAVALPMPSHFSKDNIDRYSITLTEAAQDIGFNNHDLIGFCPMSGRLIYLLKGGGEFRLADYLPTPEELEISDS
ncbi:hypothetical protein EST38_g5744 [Candolleomyces aberdarensis]|uniref:Uncharacterized protein n=1 Tax=Candolleomyces aberdarensis TaxID=2316362 RepID=A0A4Q2DJB1_9AGAR|nr:hypothetical protein EST38_g5744 [Candolleomyces aberdarensis]